LKTNDLLEKYFKRKFLKKIIMTIPYQSTLRTCQNYFIEEIEKEYEDFDKNDFFKKDNIKKKETIEINLLLKKFYEYLKNGVETEYLYEISSDEISKTAYAILKKDKNENEEMERIKESISLIQKGFVNIQVNILISVYNFILYLKLYIKIKKRSTN
jgi:hypothetical protein